MAGYVPVETVLIEYLSSEFPAALVLTETDDELADTLPVVKVERIGGGDRVITFDVARVDVEVFAATRFDARDLSEQIRSNLRYVLPGKTITGAVVGDVNTISGPNSAPWEDTSIRRFVATYEITIHCNPL